MLLSESHILGLARLGNVAELLASQEHWRLVDINLK